MGGLRPMNIILSILLTLTPVWSLSLKPVKVERIFQQELNLAPTTDDLYLILNFKQAKEVSLFKEQCLDLSSEFLVLMELKEKQESKISTLETIISEKDIQINLLERQLVTLRSVVKGSNQHDWNIGLIVLSAVVVGYITFDVAN